MGIVIDVKEKGLQVARKYSLVPYWEEQYRYLLDEHCRILFPVAPPGMLQKLRPGEDLCHMQWMCRTTCNWSFKNIRVFSTNYPDIFWVMRDAEGDTRWAGVDGHYNGRLFTRLTIRDEKIVVLKDYFDSLAMYKAAGLPIPYFKYDAPDPAGLPERPPVPDCTGSKETLLAQTRATLSKFVSVDFWDGEINANDIVHELPFTPEAMPRKYNAREYDALNIWIGENCLEWDTYPGSRLYVTDAPGTYIIESGGIGYMSWTGVKGHYENREVSYLYIENGYAKEFHEYFNPANKFNSVNTPLPTFPYLY